MYEEMTWVLEDWKGIAEGYRRQFEDCAEDRARLAEENERLRETQCDECSCQLLFERDLWMKAAEQWQKQFEKVRTDTATKIFAEIQAEIKAVLDNNYRVLPKVELSDTLWYSVRGKIDCLRGFDDFIDELKKKYAEENNEQK